MFQLQEAFAKGLLKPGLNVESVKENKRCKNKVVSEILHYHEQSIKRKLVYNEINKKRKM